MTAEQIIKKIVQTESKANACSEMFNVKYVIEEFRRIRAENNIDDVSEERAQEIIDALSKINESYLTQIKELDYHIFRSNLSSSNLLDLMFSISNLEYLKVSLASKRNFSEDDSPIIDYDSKRKVKTAFGEEIYIDAITDISVDILNESINYLRKKKINPKSYHPKLTKQQLNKIVREIHYRFNLIVIIKNTFESYKYELGELYLYNEGIKLKHEPNIYCLVKDAGRQREQNILMQGFYYATNLEQKATHSPGYQISNGIIYLNNNSKIIDDMSKSFALSTQIFFYHHLAHKSISKKIDLTVNTILEFWCALRRAIYDIDKVDGNWTSLIENEQLADIPIKIDKRSLLSYLMRELGIDEKTIVKLLAHTTQLINTEVDLWVKPLISYGNYYYFSFVPITIGHFSYYTDNIINEFISTSEQCRLYKAHIIEQLNDNPNGYKFDGIELDNSLFKGEFIVYKLDKIILCIQLCMYQYPLNSFEYSTAMQDLNQESIHLERNETVLRNQYPNLFSDSTAKVVGVLLGNHTCLSGLKLGNHYIVDEQLLLNYLHAGKLERSALNFGPNKGRSQKLSAYIYYNNEAEFNDNLLYFFNAPTPVVEIISTRNIVEKSILPNNLGIQIIEDIIEVDSISEVNSSKIGELNYSLKQLYYFENELKDIKGGNFLAKRIAFIAPQVLATLALKGNDQLERLEVLKCFEDVQVVGTIQLIYLLQIAISNLSEKEVVPDLKMDVHNNDSLDFERASRNFDLILEKNINEPVSLSNFEVKHDLSEKELIEVIEFLMRMVSSFTPRFYSEEDLTQHLQWLSFFAVLSKKQENYKKMRDYAFSNFIDSLNYNHYYQKARDVSEEIVTYSFKYDKVPTIGWLCHFKTASKQSNIYHGGFYGLLYVYSFSAQAFIRRYEAVDVLYTSLLFFRNFHLYETVDKLYKSLTEIDLDDYDNQKVAIAYFNSLLMRETDSLIKGLIDIAEFLVQHIESILSFGQQGALPWLSLMYNIKNIGQITPLGNIDFIEKFISQLENAIDEETLSNARAMYFAENKDTKKFFRNVLLRLFETRTHEDFAAQVSNLQLIAENVIQTSLEPLDVDSLLLAGLITNDVTLVFKPYGTELTSAPFFKGVDSLLKNKFENYAYNILESINIKPTQIFCWIFNLKGIVYRLTITHDHRLDLKKLPYWDTRKMKNWLQKVSQYYFNDKGDYPINEQESSYLNDLKDLSFANLDIVNEFDEILLSTDLFLSAYPHNLIQNNLYKGSILNLPHEILVKEHVEKTGCDFISFGKPITNVISLEWLSENGLIIEYALTDISMEIWIPIEDDDIVLNMGYEKIKPLLKQFNCEIHTSYLPSKPLSSLINIFFAHGGKGVEGFRAVYTSQSTEGRAILKDGGIKRVFGSGEIAILFICDSASISEQIFTQKLISFTHEILALGYKAVVAPAWHLNPDITPVWLEFFMEALKDGSPISYAVHLANRRTSLEKRYNEYHGYYAPTGWAAMHLYGNPNLKFVR